MNAFHRIKKRILAGFPIGDQDGKTLLNIIEQVATYPCQCAPNSETPCVTCDIKSTFEQA